MTTSRTYRKLNIADMSMVLQMENDFRSDLVSEENARQFLSNRMNWLFACIEDGRIIAFVYGYELNRLKSQGNILYIHEVAVLPAFHRQGIGREMLTHVKALCKLSGICRFFLFTERSNTAACGLYNAMGGKPAHEDSVVYFFNDLD